MKWNLNDADEQQGDFTPIPAGVYRLKATVRAGGFGEDGQLKLAKSFRTAGLDFKHRVVGGEFNNRVIFDLVTIYCDLSAQPELPAVDEQQGEKYKTAVKIGLAKLRAMLESAHELLYDDHSPEANAIREFDGLKIFDGLEFWASIETKQDNGYKPRNIITKIVVPGTPEWPGAAPQRPPLQRDLDDEIPF